MDRKAGLQMSFNLVAVIQRLFFILLLSMTLYFFARVYIITEINIQNQRADIFTSQILYSQAINQKNNLTQQVQPGKIQLEKFNEQEIKKYIDYSPDLLAARLKITYTKENQPQQKTAYYHQASFERWIELVGLEGAPLLFENKNYVLIKENQPDHSEKTYPGILQMQILVNEE